MFSLLDGLESPTFRLTAERASRLRHKSSITWVGWFFMHHSSFVLWKKGIFESLKLIKHSQKLWKKLAFSKKFECFQKKIRINDTSPHKWLEPLTVGLKIQRSTDWASSLTNLGFQVHQFLTNLVFQIHQIQEFEAVDPEIINLVHTFFAAISDFEVLLFSLLGRLEPPTFRLTAESTSRLRHKSSITWVGWIFKHHSGFVLWEKFIFESLKLSKHWIFMHNSSFVLWEKFIFESLKLIKHSQKLWK